MIKNIYIYNGEYEIMKEMGKTLDETMARLIGCCLQVVSKVFATGVFVICMKRKKMWREPER